MIKTNQSYFSDVVDQTDFFLNTMLNFYCKINLDF